MKPHFCLQCGPRIVIGGRLYGSGDSTKSAYFLPDSLPRNICGAGHARVVRAWQRGGFRQ